MKYKYHRYTVPVFIVGFPGGTDSEESACHTGDLGLIPGSRRSPGEGNGNPLQNSCLENPKDRGAWWAIVHGVAESDMTEQLCSLGEPQAIVIFKLFSLSKN